MGTFRSVAAGAALVLCLVAPARAQWLSGSKLGVHLDFHYTPGTRQVLGAGPRVFKILDVGGEMLAAARDYKAAYPDGLVVLRIYTRVSYGLRDDPAGAGGGPPPAPGVHTEGLTAHTPPSSYLAIRRRRDSNRNALGSPVKSGSGRGSSRRRLCGDATR